MAKDIMNAVEVSEFLGVSVTEIYALIKRKEIPVSQIGRQYLFIKRVVLEWLDSKRVDR